MKHLLFTLPLLAFFACQTPQPTPAVDVLTTLRMADTTARMVAESRAARSSYDRFLDHAERELKGVPDGEQKAELAAALRDFRDAGRMWGSPDYERAMESARNHLSRAEKLNTR